MATSYANLGGTGDRSAIIGVLASSGLLVAAPINLIDGSSADVTYFNVVSAAGHYFWFDFGREVLIDEAKWYQDISASHGTWKWQGSNDNSSWTDIGSSFTLGSAATQTHTSLNGNATNYRYLRLLGVSGTTSGGPYLREIEFKIDLMVDPHPGGTSYANTGGTGDRRSIITMSDSGIITGSAPYNGWINGSTTEDDDYFTGGALSGSVYVRWDHGPGASKIINQMKFYQQTRTFHGYWKVQGSNDAAAWTDIGHQFLLGGELLQIISAPHGCNTGYRHHQWLGVSGSTNSGPYIREVEFKIADAPAGGAANSAFFGFF